MNRDKRGKYESIKKDNILYQVEDFDLRFEPIEDSISIKKTAKGFEVRYLIQDDSPADPREDENLGKMICFHKQYSLGDKTDLNSGMFGGWEELHNYLIKEKKAIMVLPLYLYNHSNLTIKIGSFQGLLSQGHAEFDSGQVGFIYCTKEDLKRIGITKIKAEKSLQAEVEVYNQYIQDDCYSIVRETFGLNKDQIDYDIYGGYFGYNEAREALKTEI